MGNSSKATNPVAAASMVKSLLVAYEDHINDFYDALAAMREQAEELMQEYEYIEAYYPSGINLSGLPLKNPVSSKKKEFFGNVGGAVWKKDDIETIRAAMIKLLDGFEKPLEKVLGK